MPPYRPFAERFWEKVEPDGECLIWTGRKTPNGYGQTTRERSQRRAYVHRLAWEIEHGPIGEGLEVHHTCERRDCVNVKHMQLVTRQQHAKLSKWGEKVADLERQKTHCPQGHPYDLLNTRYTPQGYRYCVTCKREQSRKGKLRATSRRLAS